MLSCHRRSTLGSRFSRSQSAAVSWTFSSTGMWYARGTASGERQNRPNPSTIILPISKGVISTSLPVMVGTSIAPIPYRADNSWSGSAGRFTREVNVEGTPAYASECTVRALTFGGNPRRAESAISRLNAR
ncbi:protein of unknown function (plasmid) [Caballeronia sp. S22]